MQTFDDITNLQSTLSTWRRKGYRIALVPTMGNLHEGHLRLVDAARQHADRVVATIFVNPLQFGPDEDLERYPRTLAEDQRLLTERGCDLLFAPNVDTLYPQGQSALTRVSVPQVSEGLCGTHRPGHFDGVATVVSLLFNLTRPDVACFGEKDFQQLAVIRKLVRDQHMPIDIIGVPIARDHDGLALSSRNHYLDDKARARAGRLHECLLESARRLEQGEPSEQALTKGLQQLEGAGFQPEYLALCDTETLRPINTWQPGSVLLVAARLGSTRLIDNLSFPT
ncbi:pantoate--beta-alanine ligase [Kushneria marisflavi]|uniref:Pantothenate synthetase n=1 Tax=Kushneria marisflavi TaxID=157779 RepID=A0A240UQ02_9GAMM|nr:pantoate--beta-alanine ligase [Kushneria marisflavi]ART63564.1 pantoate--beta-alanine ligase [Kushneria marisflavi]RKD75805.1 pantothenate synthetase [Kushneria marisflavi]